MSQETWEILCEMEADDVELQLALQCAPLITGLKISNLLTISPEGFTQVGRIVEGSVLSLYPLLETEEKMVILLYREDRLEKYLKMPQVQKLLREAGYESDRLEDILPVFCDRYETYAERGKPFPHELGLPKLKCGCLSSNLNKGSIKALSISVKTDSTSCKSSSD